MNKIRIPMSKRSKKLPYQSWPLGFITFNGGRPPMVLIDTYGTNRAHKVKGSLFKLEKYLELQADFTAKEKAYWEAYKARTMIELHLKLNNLSEEQLTVLKIKAKPRFKLKKLSEKALEALREYFDDSGIKPPTPNYFYQEDDVTTHKFLNSRTVLIERTGEYNVKEKLNPKFLPIPYK